MDYRTAYEGFWKRMGAYHWNNYPYAKAKQYVYVKELLEGCSRVLDVGSGDGRLLAIVKNAIGLEVSEEAIRLCRERNIKNEIKQGSALALPFPDNSFDGVAFLDVIEHLTKEDGLKSLKEINRVLKVGGKLVLLTPIKVPDLTLNIDDSQSHVKGFTEKGKIIVKDVRYSLGHLYEYLPRELYSLLGSIFKVEAYAQLGRNTFTVKAKGPDGLEFEVKYRKMPYKQLLLAKKVR